MAGGFKSPAFWLGLSSESVVTQGGFRTPLPLFPAGGTVAVTQGGYRGFLGLWIGGAAAGEAVITPIVSPQPGGGYSTYAPRYDRALELQIAEDEEIIEILSILCSMRVI